MNEAVIAYPIDSSPTRRSTSSLMEENVYSSSLGDSKFADDTIEMSGNFFSQLDSMIAAVKVESTALDSMKEKLKEVENLRNQISNFTKRLLDADQANLNLKANLVKVQEMYAETKKAKAEVESSIVPIRAELNRTKEQCNKERQGRLQAQQQVAAMRDQISMLEQANENLDREVKTIPALAESNEILKNDLTQLRRRYKDEKTQMAKHIKGLEAQSRDVDAIRGCVRDLSMKLLDLANTGVPSSTAMSGSSSMSMNVANMSNPNSAAYIAQQQQLRMQQQQQQQLRYNSNGGNMHASAGSNVYYQQASAAGSYNNPNSNVSNKMSSAQHIMHHSDDNSDDNDYEDAEEDEESNDYEAELHVDNNNTEYENDSFVEVNSSIESSGSAVAVMVGASKSTSAIGKSSVGKKKKAARRSASGGQPKVRAQAQSSLQQPRMMQQLQDHHSGNGGNNPAAVMYQQPQQYRSNSTQQQQAPQQQQQQGLQQSFSLPRI